MKGRILAIDPGSKRIGIAISDSSGSLARTLKVIKHTSMIVDCTIITKLAVENGALKIIVGEPFGEEGQSIPQTRHAEKMAQLLKQQSLLEVELWDEQDSTRIARETRLSMGVNRKKRSGHLDDLAAVVILQTYLDSRAEIVGKNA